MALTVVYIQYRVYPGTKSSNTVKCFTLERAHKFIHAYTRYCIHTHIGPTWMPTCKSHIHIHLHTYARLNGKAAHRNPTPHANVLMYAITVTNNNSFLINKAFAKALCQTSHSVAKFSHSYFTQEKKI